MRNEELATYGQRLSHAMKLREASDASVAEAVGVTWQAIQHLRTADKVRGSKHTPAIAAYLNVDARWLSEGGKSGRKPSSKDRKDSPLERQLLRMFSRISEDGQDDVFDYVNKLYAREHPEDREADPFQISPPKVSPPPAPAVEMTRIRPGTPKRNAKRA